MTATRDETPYPKRHLIGVINRHTGDTIQTPPAVHAFFRALAAEHTAGRGLAITDVPRRVGPLMQIYGAAIGFDIRRSATIGEWRCVATHIAIDDARRSGV